MGESSPQTGQSDVSSRLMESEARYRAVIENASDMVQSCRMDGTFEFVNPSWLEKLGYTEEEVANLVVWDVIHPDSRTHCEDLFTRAVHGESIENVRADFITKDGRKLPVEGNATPRFVDGEPIATHSFFRDITERLHAEELEMRNKQLEQERMARYLEKMAALGKLAAGLAHELNNPAAAAQRAGSQLAESTSRLAASLAALHRQELPAQTWETLDALRVAAQSPSGRRPTEISRLESEVEDWLSDHDIADGWELASALVQQGIDTAQLDELAEDVPAESLEASLDWISSTGEIRELIDVVTHSTQRISDLVAAVKSYSYMDQATEQVVDVHTGIEDTLTILGHRLKRLDVRREYDRSLPPVRAFGSGLNQVWTNILDNAADAIGDSGIITIRTRPSGDKVVVEIEDNGPGIPPEHLSRVFEPFFSTKAQGEGTGLGLDTVWRIVSEDHDGTVEVQSEPGCTQFRVVLPAAPEA